MAGNSLGLAGNAAHEYEPSAALEPPVGLTRDEELAAGVDGEDTVEFFGCHVFDVAEADDTTVGKDNVELAVDGDCSVEQMDDVLYFADVGLDCDCGR